jgi:hypothetical protein
MAALRFGSGMETFTAKVEDAKPTTSGTISRRRKTSPATELFNPFPFRVFIYLFEMATVLFVPVKVWRRGFGRNSKCHHSFLECKSGVV